MPRKWAAWLLYALIALASPALAQERSAVKQGFALPANSHKTILVFRPSVSVGAQSTGGLYEPNAEWTERSRANLQAALIKLQGDLGNRLVFAPDAVGDDARSLQEHMALFAAVSEAVIRYQFFVGNRLPTKKRDNASSTFDWSLGTGVASLPGARDADYALFLYNKDEFGSTGRKLLQVAGMLGGIAIRSGRHIGYAGLVDLRTGDLLWLNADAEMGGDVRDGAGADKRIGELLKGFPGREAAKAPSQ